MSDYDPEALFRALHEAGVRYVLIGGWAVNAHGHHRYTGDVDICPDPEPANLERLAALLRGFNASVLGLEELSPAQLPADPEIRMGSRTAATSPRSPTLGVLNLMQWGSTAVSASSSTPRCGRSERGGAGPVDQRVLAAGAARDEARCRGPRDLEDLEHL